MNKTFLTRIALGLSLLTIVGQADAQRSITYETNSAAEQVGTRLMVTAPSSIAKLLDYEISNDGSGGTTQWGGAVTNPYINVQVVKAYGPGSDSLGTGTLQNGSGSFPSLAGKFALIFRGGGVTFTRKAKLCQDAGAIGCIIVNNIPGGPVGMAETAADGPVSIPVIMVTDVDGQAMNTQIRSGNSVTISLTRWGINASHDLGILNHSTVMGHAFAIPKAQMGTNNGNPVYYKNQTGAYIGNFGTSTETNVKMTAVTTWTPTGGSATTVHTDSLKVGSFPQLDSVITPFVNTSYDLHATTTGRFDMRYTISADSADAAMGDNVMNSSMYVTDSIFSKSRYDFTAGHPFANTYNRFGFDDAGTTALPYVTGPVYYVAKGGYQVKAVQFSVAINGNGPLTGRDPLNISLYKWVDANHDGVMVTDEVTQIGIASHPFVGNDSSEQFFTEPIINPTNSTIPVKVEDSSWYWLAADMPSDMFIGCDGQLNYGNRTFFRSRPTTTDSTLEIYAPVYEDAEATIHDQNALIRPIAFEYYRAGSFPDSIRYARTKEGLTPSMAMIMSTSTVGIKNVHPYIGDVNVFPNPASEMVNVSINLTEPSAKVIARITDAMGRTLRSVSYSNIQKQTIQLPVNDLAAGQYYILLNTDQGPVSHKFTVLGK